MEKEKIEELIDEERKAFIKAEYGRLQAVMGEEYTQGDQTFVFHALKEKDGDWTKADPYELTMGELAALPWLFKKINRLGAVTDMPIMSFHPEDKKRLVLLDRILSDEKAGLEIREEDLEELIRGHEKYIAFKNEEFDGPVIIR